MKGVELTHPDLKDNLLPGYDAAALGDDSWYKWLQQLQVIHGTAC